MRFNNKAPETDPFAPLPAGDYDFRIRSATEKTSANGNPMIKLVLSVFAKGRHPKIVYHNMVFTESQAFRNRQIFAAVDLSNNWETGEVEADYFVDRFGQCRLGIKTYRGNEENEANHFYPYDPARPIPPALPVNNPPATPQNQPPPSQLQHPDDNGYPPDPNFEK